MMTKVTFEDVFDGLQILPSRDDTEGKSIDILEKQKELMVNKFLPSFSP